MANLEAATADTFEAKVLKADVPVLVDFWAGWCGPCEAMAPSVEDLAREYEGEAKVYTLDIDANPATRDRHGIRGIPAFLMFRDGKVVDTIAGGATRSRLAAAIEAALGSAE